MGDVAPGGGAVFSYKLEPLQGTLGWMGTGLHPSFSG